MLMLGQNETVGPWGLFWQSFDLFTVLLLTGSIAGVAVIVRGAMDIREGRILPAMLVRQIEKMIGSVRTAEVREFVRGRHEFPARVLSAALEAMGSRTGVEAREAAREAAELAASEECARWFRRIEPLNVIGNLGPLVGLAGTVWGMIIAFAALGEAGGRAGPADLSLGISKALFHTLLGLCLAVPCLVAFGLYRGVIDRVCTRAMAVSSELVEKLLAAPGAGDDARAP